MKYIKLLTILITLILTSQPQSIYALPVGGICQVTPDCDYGLVCRRIDAGRPRECTAGLGQGATCTLGSDSCGRGFVCTYQTGSLYTCIGSAGGVSAPGEGVNIGQSFMNNFTVAFPTSPGEFVTSILGQIYVVALVILLIYLVWGAYRYMLSGGDPKAAAAARQHLTWAVVGMIIIFLSYGMFQVINNLINNIYN
ncbi:MAG: pilin [bacterium]|nr:pilin [bacterium]